MENNNTTYESPSEYPTTKEGIFELFSKYNFTDNLGHPLNNCIEFMQLVDYAVHGINSHK